MSQICSKMVTFLFSAYFAAIFVTIATVKIESIPDFLHLGYCSDKLIRRNLWKAIFIIWPHWGGQNSLLMHVPLWCIDTFWGRGMSHTVFQSLWRPLPLASDLEKSCPELFGLVWCFTSQSTAMGWSVHLTSLFPGHASLTKWLMCASCKYFRL